MKNRIQTIALLLLTIAAQTKCGVKHSLQLSENDSTKTQVILPFAYKTLNQQEKSGIRYVPECYYTVLQKNENALVGPLQPCKLVAIQSTKTGRTVVFHKNDANCSKKLCKIAQKILGEKSHNKDIRAYIFGVTSPIIEYAYKNDLHQTQHDKIKYIKDTIVKTFKIADRGQVLAQNFSIKPSATLQDYAYSQIFVLIDNNLNKNSCCPMHENFFNIKNLAQKNLERRSLALAMEMKKHENSYEILTKYPRAYSGYEETGFLEIK